MKKAFPIYNDVFYTGKLYKYNLEKKTVEMIVDMNINYLTVNENGLYFYAGENGMTAGYYLSFNDSPPKRMGDYEPVFYGNYQLKNTFSGNRHTGKIFNSGQGDLSVPVPADSMYYSIAGNKFYSMAVGVINELDLLTGERISYPRNNNAIMVDGWISVEMERIADYSVINGELYVTAGNQFIYKYDTAAKRFIPINDFNGNKHYEKLFTDGVNLYAVEINYLNGRIANVALRLFSPDENGDFVLSNLH